MKILHATTFLNGGAGRVLVDLALFQTRAGHEVYVIANKTEFEGHRHYKEHIERLKHAGIIFETCDSLFKRERVLNNRASRNLIDRFSGSKVFDVVHAHASVPAKVCYEAFTQSQPTPKYIQTMHGWGLNKTFQMERDDIKTMNTLDSVVALNESGKKLLLSKGVTGSHLHVIPNGINSRKPPISNLSGNLATFLNKRNWVLKFICIGEIGERKNQSFLMNAIRSLNELGICCCAVFMGPEQSKGYFENCVKKSSSKHWTYWTGETEDASSYIEHFDAVILPSKSEGMPITILEAFRAKVPVLGSRIPENEELLNPRRGLLFDLTSTDELVQHVVDFEGIAIQEIVKNAYKYFCSQYQLECMAESYLKLYQV